MRIHIQTTPSTKIVPFDHQKKLNGCIHKWIGDNNAVHGKLSLFSFSMLTFSLMETLAISISDNANRIAGSIRAKLKEEEENKAEPIIEENMQGVESFVTLSAGGYVRTKTESADALNKAEQALIDQLLAFDYEHQL